MVKKKEFDEFIEENTETGLDSLRIKQVREKKELKFIDVEVKKDFRNLIGMEIFVGRIGQKMQLPIYAYELLKQSGKVIKA